MSSNGALDTQPKSEVKALAENTPGHGNLMSGRSDMKSFPDLYMCRQYRVEIASWEPGKLIQFYAF